MLPFENSLGDTIKNIQSAPHLYNTISKKRLVYECKEWYQLGILNKIQIRTRGVSNLKEATIRIIIPILNSRLNTLINLSNLHLETNIGNSYPFHSPNFEVGYDVSYQKFLLRLFDNTLTPDLVRVICSFIDKKSTISLKKFLYKNHNSKSINDGLSIIHEYNNILSYNTWSPACKLIKRWKSINILLSQVGYNLSIKPI